MTTTDESYVSHDIYPPEIESTSISSSGTDTTWAKIGDSVFVTFKASEVLDEITITIAGAAANYDELSLMKYRGYHIMQESDNEGEIPFLISYSDLGGAVGPDADTTTNNSLSIKTLAKASDCSFILVIKIPFGYYIYFFFCFN